MRIRHFVFYLMFFLAVWFLLLPAAKAVAQDKGEGDKDKGSDSGEVESAEAKKNGKLPMRQDNEGLVTLDFTDVDIKEIVKTMAEMTGRNFMIDKAVVGTITIISPTKVTAKEAYDIFLSVLQVNGLTTVDVGKVTKIISKKDAQYNPIRTVTEGTQPPAPTDEIITQLIPLTNLDALDIANSFRGLVSPDGNIFAYGPANILIILDTASNVNRLFKIIQKLDIEGTEQQIEVIPIEYASASLLADVILQLYEDEMAAATSAIGGAGRRLSDIRRQTQQAPVGNRLLGRRPGAQQTPVNPTQSASVPNQQITKIIPDDRTNSLVIKASKYGIKQIRDLVEKLDTPLPWGEGKIHVVYCQNADATDLAGVLADLAGSTGTGGQGVASRTGRTPTGTSRGGYGSYSNQGRAGSIAGQLGSRFGVGQGLGSSRGGLSGGLGSSGGTGSNPLRSIGQTTGRFLADFDGAVRITADPATNSLVIIASNRDFQILQEVINKLDIPRRQVFVEILIMEITMERGLELGFEFRSTTQQTEEGIQIIGGTNYGGIQSAATNPLGITGFAIGAADGTITIGGQKYPNIGALFRAMATDRDVNVLSTPSLLTMDNQEAEIVVADNIPFITGQIFSANNTNPTTTIERKDVGITMRITPQISDSDYVRMQIYQESSQVTASPEGLSASQVGVTTSKRSADTMVVVKDRQTVVIGGLMKDNISWTETKVPVLGDIPIIGYLFKDSTRKVEKTNLLFFITPYVVKDAADLEEVTRISNDRIEKFREMNRIPDRDREFHDLNDNHVTAKENPYSVPRTEKIETDPRLRKALEEAGGITPNPSQDVNQPSSTNNPQEPPEGQDQSGSGQKDNSSDLDEDPTKQ